MTSCAGAGAATGVIEKDVKMLGYVEERHRLAMVTIG
jgi:hypothetical protein